VVVYTRGNLKNTGRLIILD